MKSRGWNDRYCIPLEHDGGVEERGVDEREVRLEREKREEEKGRGWWTGTGRP